MAFDFEKLDVWNQAVNFSTHVYRISGTFPKDELYGMTSQVRRAAVSISANIAEGAGRYSNADFLRFLRISRGSLYEVMTLIKICSHLGLVTQSEFEQLYEDGNRFGKMVNGFCRTLKNRI